MIKPEEFSLEGLWVVRAGKAAELLYAGLRVAAEVRPGTVREVLATVHPVETSASRKAISTVTGSCHTRLPARQPTQIMTAVETERYPAKNFYITVHTSHKTVITAGGLMQKVNLKADNRWQMLYYNNKHTHLKHSWHIEKWLAQFRGLSLLAQRCLQWYQKGRAWAWELPPWCWEHAEQRSCKSNLAPAERLLWCNSVGDKTKGQRLIGQVLKIKLIRPLPV